MDAWETVEGEGIVVGAAEHTAACCAAARVAKVEAALATYAMEDIHVLGSGHQEAFHLDPYPTVSCLEAYRCLVVGDAFGQVEVVCAAGPWAREPCCFVE